jgi:Arc/MetJ-type ribon-helix-helix transcriptional regulator
MRKQESRTGIRLPNEQRQQIDILVQEGKFKNLSAVVRAALTDFLAKEMA